MPVVGRFYPKAFAAAFNKEIDLNSDVIKGALALNTAFDPADGYWADITGEVTGTNYVAGGQSLGTCTVTVTVADSYATTRANTTAYLLGAIVRPATGNGYLYQASTAGTSGGTIPTYPTNVGGTVTDGTVVWTNVGQAIIALDDDGTNLQWASSTITADSLIIYDDTPATAATKPLIAHIDFGADVPSSGGPYDVVFSSIGIAAILV